jgi:hypothetical protein
MSIGWTLAPTMKKNPGNGRQNGDGYYGKDPGPHNGAVYTVAGHSGQVASFAPINHPANVVNWNVMGSVFLDINEDRLDATMIDINGVVRDWFTIKKAPLVKLAISTPSTKEGDASGVMATLSRTLNLQQPLVVPLSYKGAGYNPGDFTNAPSQIAFPVNVNNVSFMLKASNDGLAEGLESIDVCVSDVPGLRMDPVESSASLAITDTSHDLWRFNMFGNTANDPSIGGDHADPDRDGIKNLVERALGLSPTTFDPQPITTFFHTGRLAISFARPADTADLIYTVQVSDNLTTWINGSRYHGTDINPNTPATTELNRTGANPEQISVRDNTTGPHRFIRLEITRP